MGLERKKEKSLLLFFQKTKISKINSSSSLNKNYDIGGKGTWYLRIEDSQKRHFLLG